MGSAVGHTGNGCSGQFVLSYKRVGGQNGFSRGSMRTLKIGSEVPDRTVMPNCIIIGAPRSGTTSLYEYLNTHPDVYMSPVKEPDFFIRPSLDAVYRDDSRGARTPDED